MLLSLVYYSEMLETVALWALGFVNSDEFALLFGLNCINICLPNVM
jgi:hypothetical protein